MHFSTALNYSYYYYSKQLINILVSLSTPDVVSSPGTRIGGRGRVEEVWLVRERYSRASHMGERDLGMSES